MEERMARLRHMRWKSGGQVPDVVKSALSQEELKWLSTYNHITYEFQSQFGMDEDGGEGNCDGWAEKIIIKLFEI